jgi:protein TonB
MTAAGAGRASPNAHLLIGEMPAPTQFSARWREGTGLSLAIHGIALAVAAYGIARAPEALRTAGESMRVPAFFDRPGGGGGGGGGADAPDPPRTVRPSGNRPRDVTMAARPADVPPPDVNIPAMAAQPIDFLPGATAVVDGTSPGRGTGAGGGGARGPGSGPRDGTGIGDGGPRGAGGGPFESGPGVTDPQLILEVKPAYTVGAMQAKLQGTVLMEAVVLADGSIDPRSIRIVRSLDRAHGLDEQAVLAVKQWRFRPGAYEGRPVPVRVVVELTFTLR